MKNKSVVGTKNNNRFKYDSTNKSLFYHNQTNTNRTI
jgi:hypothetical protein